MFNFGLLFLVFGAIGLIGGVVQRMRAGRLGETPFAKPSEVGTNGRSIANAKGGISTEGQVQAMQTLTSPVTGRSCFYYETKLEAEWKQGEVSIKVELGAEKNAMPFALSDGMGQVTVALTTQSTPEFDDKGGFDRKKFSRGLMASIGSKPLEVTPHYNIPAGLQARVNGRMVEVPVTADFFVTEKVLEAKPFFYVNGKLDESGAIVAPSWISMIISEKSRDTLLAASQGLSKKAFIGGGVAVGLGAVLAIAGVIMEPSSEAQAEDAGAPAPALDTAAEAVDDQAPSKGEAVEPAALPSGK